MCPDLCILGNIQTTVAFTFLSVKRTILMNWKIQKSHCFNMQNWLVESSTSVFSVYDNGNN